MGDFIEQLYLGTLDAQRLAKDQNPRLSELATELEGLEQQLSYRLTGKELALFLRFCNLTAEFSGADRMSHFKAGFVLGGRLGLDLFGSDEN